MSNRATNPKQKGRPHRRKATLAQRQAAEAAARAQRDTGPRVPTRAERIALRGFAVAWGLIALFLLLAGIVIGVGAVTQTIPPGADGGVLDTTADYPIFAPPYPLVMAAGVLLVLLALWTIPLRIDERFLTYRLVQAIACGAMTFVALLGSTWWIEDSVARGDLVFPTVYLYVGAAALFGLRWFLELVHLVPKSWRSESQLDIADWLT